MRDEEIRSVYQHIERFFKTALKYYGKEIGLVSNQYFGIDEIRTQEGSDPKFRIQYGFPQSGCVLMEVEYSKEEHTVFITKIESYAPPADRNIMMGKFSNTSQEGPVSISINFGMDMGTQSHVGVDEISKNPNAIQMIKIATSDLDKAQVFGECRLCAPSDSDTIPCCDTRTITADKGNHR